MYSTIQLTAQNETEYRRARMRECLAYATAKVGSFETFIAGLEDRKGSLLVTWARPPYTAQLAAIEDAWAYCQEDPAMVEHWLPAEATESLVRGGRPWS